MDAYAVVKVISLFSCSLLSFPPRKCESLTDDCLPVFRNQGLWIFLIFQMRLEKFAPIAFFVTSTSALFENTKVHNANHVFNAIHSSMRQWGSSLNHNGMSFFLATVPAGTQLYHGTEKSDFIQGMQWLAFEPEHALIFARPKRGPPHDEGGKQPKHQEWREEEEMSYDEHEYGPFPMSDHGSRPRPAIAPHHPHEPPFHHEPPFPPPPPGHQRPPPDHHIPAPPPDYHRGRLSQREPPPPPSHYARDRKSQQRLGGPASAKTDDTGYLHTYVPKHPLRLLYVDGLSAGKTNNGTLDTQDMLLLNLTSTNPHSPMGGEIERAEGLCNLTTTLWEGKIDGILRMEAGFEIILCDFAKHLERKDIIAVTGGERQGGPGGEGAFGGWQYIKAITSRYQGIGSERVTVDYEDFVSVFAYPEIGDLFSNDVQSDYPMPRLQKVKKEDILRIRQDITDVILQKDWATETKKTNWQAVADQVVTRYGKSLHYMHTTPDFRTNKLALSNYLTTLLRPFISQSRNSTLETQRCVAQFVPPLSHPPLVLSSLAHRTLHNVTTHICDTLFTALSISSASVSHSSFMEVYARQAVEVIDELVEYLQWTSWKDCGACGDEEVCFVPIWPMGSHEDHERPRCLDEKGVGRRGGYWGMRGGRPGPGKGERPPPPPPPPPRGGAYMEVAY